VFVLSAKEYLLVWIDGGRNAVDVLAKEAIHYVTQNPSLTSYYLQIIAWVLDVRNGCVNHHVIKSRD
jgi:hypothetical protein